MNDTRTSFENTLQVDLNFEINGYFHYELYINYENIRL